MFDEAIIGDEAIRNPREPREASSEVWKWICAALLALLMSLGAYALRGGITRAEAEQLVTGPTNPYVANEPALNERLSTIEGKVDDLQNKVDKLQDNLNRLCIALGVDPDGNVQPRPARR